MKHANRLVLIAISLLFGFAANSNGDETATVVPEGTMADSATVLTGRLQSLKPELFNTPQAKVFMTTGKNPYIGKQEAIDKGKKLFQLYSCTQCHGGDAQGQTGPGLHGPNFKYAQNASNMGMFDTIWFGTSGGMGPKGQGLMDPTDPANGLIPDEVLKIEAWIRSHGKSTGNE